MRRDLIIGFVAAGLVHAIPAYISQKYKAGPPEVVINDEPVVVALEMPPLEPEEPEEIIESVEEFEPIEFAPPMQNDLPQVVMPESFVIPPTPPPPDSLKPAAGVVSIPKGNLNARIGQIFNLADLDQQPQPTFQTQPVYPADMRRRAVSGEVLIGFIVDANGIVQQVRVESSTHHEFEAAAVAAVQKWKFRAGRKGGKNVSTRMQVPIVFSLQNSN